MIDPANYDKPQYLSTLMFDVLRPDELDGFSKFMECLQRLVNGDPFNPLGPDSSEYRTVCVESQGLRRKVISRVRYALQQYGLVVYGWPYGVENLYICTSTVPVVFDPDSVDAALTHNLSDDCEPVNMVQDHWFSIDNQVYGYCGVIRHAALLMEPLERGGAPRGGLPGRPMNPKIRAALLEACRRIDKGEKRDVAALEVAKDYGIKAATLRSYLKPSRRPKAMER